jgi:ABC-type spermidine/putrescine transport system permease subunit I
MANGPIGFVSKKFLAGFSFITLVVALGIFTIVSSITGTNSITGASSVSNTISTVSNTVFSLVIALIVIIAGAFIYLKTKKRS